MKSLLIVIVTLLLATTAHAQLRAPQLLAGDQGNEKDRKPLGWPEAIDEATIRVEVIGAAPHQESGPAELSAFKLDQGRHEAHTTLKGAKLDRDLVIALAPTDRQVLVEKWLAGASVQEM